MAIRRREVPQGMLGIATPITEDLWDRRWVRMAGKSHRFEGGELRNFGC